jgi:phosphoribosylformylglycinamidine synthase subunit PurQ / glutaminase
MIPVKALVLTGFGLNCDYETDYALKLAGADSHPIHINELIYGDRWGSRVELDDYHILVFGGGFSWADDHGAGVLLASKIGFNLTNELDQFIRSGKLVIGICNGFQAIVNLGLLPGFNSNYQERRIALIPNAAGNFINAWVRLKINPESPGNFYALDQDMESLFKNKQVVAQYADSSGNPADGQWPANPNGSLQDIAGICDPTGRIFGLMPHPEAFNHVTNHPDWTRRKEALLRHGKTLTNEEGEGVKVFRNAVDFIREEITEGRMKLPTASCGAS